MKDELNFFVWSDLLDPDVWNGPMLKPNIRQATFVAELSNKVVRFAEEYHEDNT